MPDDRFIHPRLGHSEKVNQLSDFERNVWLVYLLAADDFGVMRYSAVSLQDAAAFLEARPSKQIMRALDRVKAAGLIRTFDHQGQAYCYQHDWQKWQRVRYPRTTHQPAPSPDLLAECCGKTSELFREHHGDYAGKFRESSGNISAKFPQSSGNVSESLPSLLRAGVRETAHGLRQEAQEGGPGETACSVRAGSFCAWYGEAYQRLLGVGYIGNPRRDYDAALLLCGTLSDQEIRDAATVWFGADDDFAKNGTRTIPKFTSRASGYLEKLKARGIA